MNKRPVIGVFVNRKFFWHPKGRLFAKKLEQANEIAGCFIYFFTPDNIDWSKRTINGFLLDYNRESWSSHRLPFPDIIYDRAVGINRREFETMEAVRNRFRNLPGIRFINSTRLEKWEVYQGLSRHKEIAGYLPETILYRSELDLQRMFNKYRLVFLKFSGGSGGKEVLSMEKEPGGIKVSFIRGGYYRERTYPSTGRLHMSLYQVIASAPGQIILQQGLRLVRYRGNVLDLRVLLVKNRDGRWVDVYNQARIAGRGANITNIAQGGTVMNYSDLIPDLRKSYSRVPADEQIRADALLIASYLEKVFGPFGEIGMDMAVDEDGKVWFLEGNSKASKLPERGLEDTRGISPQFLLILEYAILLFQKSKV